MNDRLKVEIELLPESPGVYIMYNVLNKVIYVGKAKNLRKRVAQYFLRPQVGKVARMAREADHFDTIQTGTEKEALLLEINLIQKHYPRFNILLKDGKKYPFIGIKKSDSMCLRVMYDDNDKNYKYYGPYPNYGYCYEVIDLLNKIYPLRKCKTLPNSTCLYYHMHQCLGPCINKIDQGVYDEMLEEIDDFLNGKNDDKRKEIYNLMMEESKALNFEKAGEYKKILDAIDNIVLKQSVQSFDTTDRDVFAISNRDGYVALAVLTYRHGKLLGKDLFIEEETDDINEEEVELIAQYYQKHKEPKEIVVANKDIIETLSMILNAKVLTYQTGPKLEIINMALKNAKAGLDEHFQTARLEDDKQSLLDELGGLLGIDTPYTIELFDNSHIQGSNAIGAMVCYVNGEKAQKLYRKFHIEGEEKRDDFASMHEIIYRRYKRLKEEEKEFPDLIIVDGGLGQIHAASSALDELGVNINLAGLYKNDKHQTRGLMDRNGQTFDIEDKSPLFFFLMRMQDEVHRYAITFHRQLRSKSMTESIFDDIEGLGKKRKELLLSRYPTIKDVKEASNEELEQILPKQVVLNIKDKLNNI